MTDNRLAAMYARQQMVTDLDLRGYKASVIVAGQAQVHTVRDVVGSAIHHLRPGGPPAVVTVFGGDAGVGTIVLTRTTNDRIMFEVNVPDPLPEVADMSDADLVANLISSKQPIGVRQQVLMDRLTQRLGDRVLVDALEQLIEDRDAENNDPYGF